MAALLPLLVGGMAISGALAGLRLIGELTPLSVFSLNIVLGLGLGLAIDYSLLIISRFREELARGRRPSEAARETFMSAGWTVLISGLTVATAMSALLLFPHRYLFSLGVGGVLVSVFATAVAVVILPLALLLLGHRVDALSLRRRHPPEMHQSRWYRLCKAVMRSPRIFAVAIIAGLLVLASPALDVRLTSLDPGVLPAGAEAREVADSMERDLAGQEPAPIYLAIQAPHTAAAGEDLDRYIRELSQLDSVRAVGDPRPVAAISGG